MDKFEKEIMEGTKEEAEEEDNILEMRKPYTTWDIDGTEYKLKLRTSDICRVEERLGTSCVSIIAGTGYELPKLITMLIVIQTAMQKYHHGKSVDDVCELFDDYVDAGGSQQSLYSDVFLPLFINSGFFNLKQTKALQKIVDGMKA